MAGVLPKLVLRLTQKLENKPHTLTILSVQLLKKKAAQMPVITQCRLINTSDDGNILTSIFRLNNFDSGGN